MKTALITTLALTLLAGSAAAEPILVGSPTTLVLSDKMGVTGFVADVQGSHVRTETTDGSGLGYDISLYFRDAAGAVIGQCNGTPGDESCDVPAGATQVEVRAFFGLLLDVELIWSD